MQEISMDCSSWRNFWQEFDALSESIKPCRADVLEAVGTRVADEVQASVRRSGLKSYGRVQRWQVPHLGTQGGYVAVRAESVVVPVGGSGTGRMNAGAVTNILNAGHAVRGPSGRAVRYRPRAEKFRVPGKHFYNQELATKATNIAVDEARRMISELKEDIEKC